MTSHTYFGRLRSSHAFVSQSHHHQHRPGHRSSSRPLSFHWINVLLLVLLCAPSLLASGDWSSAALSVDSDDVEEGNQLKFIIILCSFSPFALSLSLSLSFDSKFIRLLRNLTRCLSNKTPSREGEDDDDDDKSVRHLLNRALPSFSRFALIEQIDFCSQDLFDFAAFDRFLVQSSNPTLCT
jgi:hypothetical protein